MATCPRCRAAIAGGSSGCPSCGIDFAQYAQYLVREQKKTIDTILTECRECGNRHSIRSALCPRCQAPNMERYYRKMGEAAGAANSAGGRYGAVGNGRGRSVPGRSSRIWLIVAAMLLVLTLFLVGNYYLVGKRSHLPLSSTVGQQMGPVLAAGGTR